MANMSIYTLKGHQIEAPRLPAGLYIVATPIGNLGDMTIRGLETLAASEIIACEDTRVSGVLLRHYGISARLVAYHDHNSRKALPRLLEALDRGQTVSLISDAGTPLVSDPGYRLVRAVLEAGHAVTGIPGASSVLAALTTAGLPTDSFMFCGFLPTKSVARRKRLEQVAHIPATLVMFESASRLAGSLDDMAAVLGDRAAVVAREITKKFEESRRATLNELAGHYREAGPPKGEIVVVIAPPDKAPPSMAEAEVLLVELLATQTVSQAAAEAASATGLPRRALYQRALALSAGGS
jgi:16S rRNA (cytidine1402-2'-O)-methyltransferase